MRIRPAVLAAIFSVLACGGGATGEADTGTADASAADASTADASTDAAPTTGAAESTGATAGTSTTGGSSGDESSGDVPLEGYDDPGLWLCHPDKPVGEDQCLSADLDVTELLADGTTALVEHTFAADPAFDCFYVYPTVDLRIEPAQTEDFVDIDQELDPLLNQAARFTRMCRMFAPLYHQVTLGTFNSDQAEVLLDAAYQDVLAAFTSYLDRHAGDRPLVIMGHSQGTFMTTRLIQEVVEPDEALRGRLLAALLIGGSVSVPDGELVGGSFTGLPLCQAPEELGCVIAYRTFAADLPPEPGTQGPDIAGNTVACTNPAALGGPATLARGAVFPTFSHQEFVFPSFDFGPDIDTQFVMLRDFFALECQTDSDGLGFLAASAAPAADDMRTNPVDFENPLFGPGFLGLHVLDYNLAMEDLLALVEAKAAAAGL
jgi:hypothetical protein